MNLGSGREGRRPARTGPWLGVVVAIALCLGPIVHAAEPSAQAGWPLLVVTLDGLDWAWLERSAMGEQTPHLQALIQGAARGVYNPLAPFRDGAGAYLSLATGVRVESASAVRLASGEPAASIFERRTGRSPSPGAYLLLDLPRLQEESRTSGSFAPLGWLGEGLREAGVRVALMGDDRWVATPAEGGPELPPVAAWADRSSPLAAAGLLVVDTQGQIEAVQPLAVSDPTAPGGLRTDWGSVPGRLREMAGAGGADGEAAGDRVLAVVASGDLWRLLREGPEMAAPAREAHHRALAAELDRLVGWWQGDPYWSRGSLLLLGATAPSMDGRDGRLLSAIVWRGPWEPRALRSLTARRDGLVMAIDVAPTLARMAGISVPSGVIGRPLALGSPAPSVGALRDWADDRALIWSGRMRVMGGLITAQVLILAVGLGLAAALRMGHPSGWVHALSESRGPGLVRLALAWAVAVPLVLLHPWVAAPPVPAWGGTTWSLAAVAVGAGAVAWVAGRVGRRLGVSATTVIAASSVAVLAADVMGRLDLIARSFMGFDLIGGARMYGIGNEHMGLLLGSALVAAGEIGERWPRASWALTLVLLGLAWMVAAPGLGANVGGLLAVATGVGVAAAGWHADARPRLRAAVARALAGAALAACLLTVAWTLDAGAATGQQSHLAMTVEKAQELGPAYVISVAARKLALNWRLLRYSLYSRVLFTAMLVVMAAFWLPAGGLLRALTDNPRMRVTLEASALGAAVALMANDSGVTAAAGALLVPAAWVLERALKAAPAARATRTDGEA